MLEFPQMFQRAGLLPSMVSLGLVCVVSTLFATTLADTIARIPHNKSFSRRIEFSDVFEQYIGRRTAMLTQVVFFLNLLSQNLAAIVACAQMFDAFGANFWPGATYALRLSPAPVTLVRWDSSLCGIGDVAQADPDSGADACVPFASEGEGALLMTAGYLATMLLLAPLGLLTLEENMLQQKFSFCALFALSIQFLFTFLSTGLTAGSLPWIGHHWAESLGVVIFNFAFCVTVPRCSALACLTCIPEASPCMRMHEDGNPRKALPALIIALSVTTRAASRQPFRRCSRPAAHIYVPRDRSWLNEKAPSVSVNRVFWGSTVTSTILYTFVGVLGAMAFPQVPENMLSLMLSNHVGLPTRLCATLFGVVIIGFGIPIFCVIMRYNLVSGGLCSEPWAHLLASALPWSTAWMLYQGSVTLKLLSWSGLVLNGFIDFLMPGVVTLVSLGLAYRLRRCCRWLGHRQRTEFPAVETLPADADNIPGSPRSPLGSTPIQPFPAWIAPYYVEIVMAMIGFLLVLLPAASWLQIYCGESKRCYPKHS